MCSLNLRIMALALAALTCLSGPTVAGPVEGEKIDISSVDAYSTMEYTEYFRGGELAHVFVSGDGDTDLDLFVYDENGNLIVEDTDYTDDCVVAWTPNWTGRFTLRIKNLGSVYNEFTIRAW